MAGCVFAVGSLDSPFSFLGGIIFFPFAVVFAVAEWVGWYRCRRDIEKTLAVICLILAGLAAFGVITNVGEALQQGWPKGFGWSVFIGSFIAVYIGMCGVWRIRMAPYPHPQLTGDAREG